MISNKTLNRDSKPEDWASYSKLSSHIFLRIYIPVKNQRFLQTQCDDAEVPAQPSPQKRSTGPLSSSRLSSCCSHLLHRRSNSPGRDEMFYFSFQWGFIVWGREKIGGRKRIFCFRFCGVCGVWFSFVLMFKVCNSGTTFSGLFSKFFLDD